MKVPHLRYRSLPLSSSTCAAAVAPGFGRPWLLLAVLATECAAASDRLASGTAWEHAASGHQCRLQDVDIDRSVSAPSLLQTSRFNLELNKIGAMEVAPAGLQRSISESLINLFTLAVVAMLAFCILYFIFHDHSMPHLPGSMAELEEQMSPSRRDRPSARSLSYEDSSESDDALPMDVKGDSNISRVTDRVLTAIAGEDEPEKSVQELLEKRFNSKKLFIKVVINLGEVWSVLILMYWSLFYNTDELMDCQAYRDDALIMHACEYTYACLTGFPHLAFNVTLAMTIRTLIQLRIYYTFLSLGHVMDFADNHILNSAWPWLCGLSIAQGGLHIFMKMLLEVGTTYSFWMQVDIWMRLVRRFVLPGSIFIGFFLRYAEIENVLIPLNRIVEKDYDADGDRYCPYLSTVKALDERVLASDARHRDIVGDIYRRLGRSPTLSEVCQDMIDNYDRAFARYKGRQKVKPKSWGLFKSLWPAAVLVDFRLDWQDAMTRQWLQSIGLTATGCLTWSALSLLFFVWITLKDLHQQTSEMVLGRAVRMVHGIIVFHFLYRTIHGMFYLKLTTEKKT